MSQVKKKQKKSKLIINQKFEIPVGKLSLKWPDVSKRFPCFRLAKYLKELQKEKKLEFDISFKRQQHFSKIKLIELKFMNNLQARTIYKIDEQFISQDVGGEPSIHNKYIYETK